MAATISIGSPPKLGSLTSYPARSGGTIPYSLDFLEFVKILPSANRAETVPKTVAWPGRISTREQTSVVVLSQHLAARDQVMNPLLA